MRTPARPLIRPAVAALLGLAALLIPRSFVRPPASRPERQSSITIKGASGGKPRFVFAGVQVPHADRELDVTASVLADVLWADLTFEDVFDLSPRLQGAEAAVVSRPSDGPGIDGWVARWRAAGADGVVSGEVHRDGAALRFDLRIDDVRSAQLAFGREYIGAMANPRRFAHVAADEILGAQAGIVGVAHSRLAFVSDRSGGFKEPTGSLRRVKEIFIADYDGANERRLTVDGDLDLTPSWSPDGRAVAYTSYRRGYQDIFVSAVEDRRQTAPTGARGKNWLPAWSPDGTRMAFTSNRDGNEEIYVMSADGRDVRRLTRDWAISTSPAWSPDGTQIAFTSNRTGSPQIWVMGADGSNPRAVTTEKYCDRPSWSPGPVNEIVYVSRTNTGFDIKVIELATGAIRQLTAGRQNESPVFGPNGRHIAFTSSRSGTQQIWMMTRTGGDLRQMTRLGNNSMVSWSR
ncbi:MAG TPA: hypothetical protein VGK32_01775 [Vicinamibacterales bacterium]|jgi:TolB protein